MDLTRLPEDVELSADGSPLAAYPEALAACVSFLTITQLFLAAVWLGFEVEWLARSPLITIAGWLGTLFVFLCSLVIAFLVFGLCFGHFSFWDSLTLMVQSAGFRTGMGVMCLSFFLARVLAGTFRRMSYASQVKVAYCLLGSIIASASCVFPIVIESAEVVNDRVGDFPLGYLVAFVLYACFGWPREVVTQHRRGARQARMRTAS